MLAGFHEMCTIGNLYYLVWLKYLSVPPQLRFHGSWAPNKHKCGNIWTLTGQRKFSPLGETITSNGEDLQTSLHIYFWFSEEKSSFQSAHTVEQCCNGEQLIPVVLMRVCGGKWNVDEPSRAKMYYAIKNNNRRNRLNCSSWLDEF